MSSNNLLPKHMRENLVYGHRNIKLIKWCIFMLVGIFGIGLVVLLGLSYINQNISQLEEQTLQARQKLADQDLEGTQKRVEELSSNFKLAIQVLSRQVLFSKLLEQAGAAMPSGAVLASLTIDEPEGGIDVEAVTKDYQSATQVPINLEQSGIFERVDIVNIACGVEDPTYPCRGVYRVLFADDNSFTLLDQTNGASP